MVDKEVRLDEDDVLVAQQGQWNPGKIEESTSCDPGIGECRKTSKPRIRANYSASLLLTPLFIPSVENNLLNPLPIGFPATNQLKRWIGVIITNATDVTAEFPVVVTLKLSNTTSLRTLRMRFMGTPSVPVMCGVKL
jgi:hypothetical protein